jgi:hypothetical protein
VEQAVLAKQLSAELADRAADLPSTTTSHGERMAEQKKNVRGTFVFIFIFLLSLPVVSCGSMASRQDAKMEKGLRESVDAFNFAFRWEEYSAAAAFLPTSRKADFWCLVDTFKGRLRIVDYEVREIELLKGIPRGTAIVAYQYYLSASPILEKATFTQKWYYTEQDKMWRVERSGFDAIARTDVGF